MTGSLRVSFSERKLMTLPTKYEFFAAIKKGDEDIVSEILSAVPGIHAEKDENGATALLTAAYYRKNEIIELLVNHGASMDLFEACAAGFPDQVKKILEKDPFLVNDFSLDGYQPIGLAAFFGHTDIVLALIELGAEVDTPSKNGMQVTPLNSAVAGGTYEIARALLDQGADPNKPQADNFVPLHAAAQNGQREMVELLLKHGANPAILNSAGKSALEIALESGHKDLQDLLV